MIKQPYFAASPSLQGGDITREHMAWQQRVMKELMIDYRHPAARKHLK